MDFFRNARAVSLRSNHGKYLVAEEDKASVSQDRNGSVKCAKWTVEKVGNNNIRLKSCYGKYLTASAERFLLGATGRKVIQSLPRNLDSTVEWKPIKDGEGLTLQTASGKFLRANGSLPPWRNSVTHNVPLNFSSQDIVWHVDILESEVQKPTSKPHDGAGTSAKPPGGTNNSAKPPRPANRPPNAPGQQVKPGAGIAIGTSLSYVSALANVADAVWDMANGRESIEQDPTAISQPKNGMEVADGDDADRDAAGNGQGEAAGDAEVYEGGDVACDEGAGSIFDFFSSTLQSL